MYLVPHLTYTRLFCILRRCYGCIKRRMLPEKCVTRDLTSQISAQEHNFITLFSDLGESGACFMEKISLGLLSASLRLLWTARFTCCWSKVLTNVLLTNSFSVNASRPRTTTEASQSTGVSYGVSWWTHTSGFVVIAIPLLNIVSGR